MQKKTYRKPTFLRHGSVEQVTMGVMNGTFSDGGTMANMNMMVNPPMMGGMGGS